LDSSRESDLQKLKLYTVAKLKLLMQFSQENIVVHWAVYLTLEEFCTCTQTYRKYADQIDPYPKNLEETILALEALCQHIIDPVIDEFGESAFSSPMDFAQRI
jgi:hypothetical protein